MTLTIADTLESPTMVYSQAMGDVHIITYNGTLYDFQAAGEFTLAKSRVPGDAFDIQLRLQPLSASASVTLITQVAVSLADSSQASGIDRITFDWKTRTDPVYVNGVANTTLSMASPDLTLPGGTITEISPNMFRVNWNTGETMTVTGNSHNDNVIDGIPLSEPGLVAGLQGEDEGTANDFQLNDGTVIPSITQSELYGEFANSWQVSPASSLFDGPAPSTFRDVNFPNDPVKLSDLPQSVVNQAAAVVKAAGITDPGLVQAAELDYIATGSTAILASTQTAQQQIAATIPVTPTSSPATPAIGILADATSVHESQNSPVAVTFEAYMAGTRTSSTAIAYTVVAPDQGDLGAAAFGGSLPSGTVTIAAGQNETPITITVPQNALGTMPSADLEVQVSSPDGLPVFAKSADTTVINYQAEPGPPAVAALAEISGGGVFTQSGDSYTLDLGTVAHGASLPTVQFAIANTANAPADSLGGTFTAPLGNGFLVDGNTLPSPLAPGGTYQGLYVAPETYLTGSHSETFTFQPTDLNASDYSALLPTLTLTIEDTVAAAAQAQLNTPATIIFPNVHVGTVESQKVSITNSAPPNSANLDVTPAAENQATAAGTITLLAPGATDAADLSIGLDTTNAGAGTVTLNAASDLGNGRSAPIAPDQVIDVFGGVYRLATASAAPTQAVFHVGDAGGLGTVALTVGNTDKSDGYSENLLASANGATGGFTAAGSTGEIAAGQSNSAITLDFSTKTAETVSGHITLALISDGGIGNGSIDGLGQTPLSPQSVAVSATVDNYAVAGLSDTNGVGTFGSSTTASGAVSYTLSLGTVAEGSTPLVVDLSALNLAPAGAPADVLSGSFSASGSSAFADALNPVGGIVAGGSAAAGTVTLDTNASGAFSETVTFDPTGSNASGYSGAL
ncbi:MAG TPA: choice-of-anchor D domain-containing protein, partial [Stellaceae bacterium]|nr:choice-of-anchor D domain-containing protein [Stellaceae bacterium]